jgi:hypothetical protein
MGLPQDSLELLKERMPHHRHDAAIAAGAGIHGPRICRACQRVVLLLRHFPEDAASGYLWQACVSEGRVLVWGLIACGFGCLFRA